MSDQTNDPAALADAERLTSFAGHAAQLGQSVHDSRIAPRPSGPRGLVSRAAAAGSAHQDDINGSISAALTTLTEIVQRMDLRLSALESAFGGLAGRIHTIEQAAPSTDSGGSDDALRAVVASQEVVIDELAGQIESLSGRLDQLSAATPSVELVDGVRDNSRRLEDRLDQARGDIAQNAALVETLLHDFRGAPAEVERTADESARLRISGVYARFEDRFRGTRDQVLERLHGYDADIPRLGKYGRVVDIGSGRGEWLELLRDHGVDAYGVDSNPDFVNVSRERGLEVIEGDALAHLAEVPPGSLGAVTGFHIIEHLPIESVIELLDRCLVALAPGGRILFETPNPNNLTVGASSFYLDPTHLRPLHPDLMGFMLTDRGYIDPEVRYLHPARLEAEETHPLPAEQVSADQVLQRAIFGPRDYAVLGSKPGRTPQT